MPLAVLGPHDVVSLQITGLAIGAERATDLTAIGLVVNAKIVKPRAHWLWACIKWGIIKCILPRWCKYVRRYEWFLTGYDL